MKNSTIRRGFSPPPKKAATFPDENGVGDTDLEIKNKAIEVLKSGKPFLFQAVCMLVNEKGKCDDGNGHKQMHNFVVSDYKKVCNSNNRCYDLFKVYNCWSKDWQNKNNDG